MQSNVVLEQYSKYKKMELADSPFHFLVDDKISIERNPHQINAFCAAIKSLKTGGIILADEVGLGKTIEAGLVLMHALEEGAKRALVVVPASLRKQWEEELKEKFALETAILDRRTIEKDGYRHWRKRLGDNTRAEVILVSHNYAHKFMQSFSEVKWDLVVIDEAHNMRNVFHGAKRAKGLYDSSQGIPKVLLTATPIQNSLRDLHALVSFIDPRIFGSEKTFLSRYNGLKDYSELKKQLKPVLYRTLRRDVTGYMSFTKRICKTFNFALSAEERELYDRVSAFLKRDELYSIPVANRSLIILVMRKLLASSSFALRETFEVFKKRLKKLYEGTKSGDAQEGFDLFWSFVEDEIEELGFEENADDGAVAKKKAIQDELDEVNAIIALIDAVKRTAKNAKIEALKAALKEAFSYQKEMDLAEKAVIFTESTRTQSYIAEELRKAGYKDEDVLIFNGGFDGALNKKILKVWQAKNYGRTNYGLNVEFKRAIVDYFKENAKVLVCTDVASEGLNLQFCNTVVNYDLPWNPMKIEQRIGRCHRYGQKSDVVAINLLNTQNEADKRVYEILSKKFNLFEGVFGASDIALGALESGVGFEKMVLEIYQSCNTAADFDREFDKLERGLAAEGEKAAAGKKEGDLSSILRTESGEEKSLNFDKTNADIEKYLRDVKYWNSFGESEFDGAMHYWKVEGWGEKVLGAHGSLFVGAFCNGGKMLFPALLLCDEAGSYVPYDEAALVQELEQIDDMDVRYFRPDASEEKFYQRAYDNLKAEMQKRYQMQTEPVKEYNRRKIENWERIRKMQLVAEQREIVGEIADLKHKKLAAKNSYEKEDIQKKIDEKTKALKRQEASFPRKEGQIKAECEREIAEFDKQFDIDPILLVNIVLKF